MEPDDVLRLHFETFSKKGAVFSEDWMIEHFEEVMDKLDLIYSGETCSNNPACGDESESIYEEDGGGHTFYFAVNSTGGPRGPFIDVDDAIRALGYDPDRFSIDFGPFDPNAELPDPKCPICGKQDAWVTCEHHLATIHGNSLEEGTLLEEERVKAWATWIEKALTDGKSRGVMPKGVTQCSALGYLARHAKTRSRRRPYRVNTFDCVDVIRELLENSDALQEERCVLTGEEGPNQFLDFYSEDPERLLGQCEEQLRNWLELPAENK